MAQLALSLTALVVLVLSSYDYISKLLEDNARISYGWEISQVLVGCGMLLAALGWLVMDGLRMRKWEGRLWVLKG